MINDSNSQQSGDAILDKLRAGGLSIDGDNAYKRDLLDVVVGAMAFGYQNTNPLPTGHWGKRFWDIGREYGELPAAAPAVVSQQLTTAATCTWKHDEETDAYSTGCGQTWHFTEGTPEEHGALFCHHCGGVLVVEQRQLFAYQVGDNDIVAAYDPAGAIKVLEDFTGGGYDFDEDDVELVSDKALDASEVYDQDEGKIVPLEKTLRQELAELTEPAYMLGWE